MPEPEETPAATNFITKEDFATAMKAQQERIASAMDTFGDQVSKAVLSVKEAPNGTIKENKSDNKSGSVRDEAIALIDDPDAYIARVIDKKMASNDDLDSLRNDLFIDRVTELEKDYDSEYGTGAFKEQILPDLMKAANELPAKMKASKNHMRLLYQGIKGGIPADKLVEKRMAVKNAEKEAELSREAPAMLRGVGVPREKGDKLDADEVSYLDSLAAKGIKYTKEEYIRDRKMGSDMDAEMENQRAKEKK